MRLCLCEIGRFYNLQIWNLATCCCPGKATTSSPCKTISPSILISLLKHCFYFNLTEHCKQMYVAKHLGLTDCGYLDYWILSSATVLWLFEESDGGGTAKIQCVFGFLSKQVILFLRATEPLSHWEPLPNHSEKSTRPWWHSQLGMLTMTHNTILTLIRLTEMSGSRQQQQRFSSVHQHFVKCDNTNSWIHPT